MSTKVHHGFKINTVDLWELHGLMTSLRATCEPLARWHLTRTHLRRMIEEADERRVLPEVKREESVWSTCFKRAMDAEAMLKKGRRQPQLDFSFEVCLVPRGAYLLGLWYTEQRVFQDELFKLPKVEPYPYWNNTDQPEGISDEEWRARGEEWGEAIGWSAPAEKGFTYQITRPQMAGLFERELVTAEMHTSFEDRVARGARSLAIHRKWDKEAPPENAVGVYLKIERWLRDAKEGKAYLEGIKREVAGLLPERYSVDDFFESPVEGGL